MFRLRCMWHFPPTSNQTYGSHCVETRPSLFPGYLFLIMILIYRKFAPDADSNTPLRTYPFRRSRMTGMSFGQRTICFFACKYFVLHSAGLAVESSPPR